MTKPGAATRAARMTNEELYAYLKAGFDGVDPAFAEALRDEAAARHTGYPVRILDAVDEIMRIADTPGEPATARKLAGRYVDGLLATTDATHEQIIAARNRVRAARRRALTASAD
jgi:hypothetical protein